MADNHTKEIRSMNMSHIRSTNSKPEEIVRKFLFAKGLRYSCLLYTSTFLTVQVRNPPGSGTDIAEGKGDHHEVESERSWMWGNY